MRSTLTLLLSALALVACRGERQRRLSPATGSRFDGSPGRVSAPVSQGADERAARVLRRLHRLGPDRRFVAAFTRIASLARRGEVKPCRAHPEPRGWTLRCRKGSEWRLPERAGFDRMLAALKAWARQRVKLVDVRGRAPSVPEPFPAEAALRQAEAAQEGQTDCRLLEDVGCTRVACLAVGVSPPHTLEHGVEALGRVDVRAQVPVGAGELIARMRCPRCHAVF